MAQCCDLDFLFVRYRVRLQPGPSIQGVSVVNHRLGATFKAYAVPRSNQMNEREPVIEG